MQYVAVGVGVCTNQGAVCTMILDVLAFASIIGRCTQVARNCDVFSYSCFCKKVRHFSRSQNSTVEICTQKGGQRPLIAAKPEAMHNSELCSNQRTLHLDCLNFAI